MVEVARSPSMDDPTGPPAEFSAPEPVLLPPNQPGRLEGPPLVGMSTASGSRPEEPRAGPTPYRRPHDNGPAVNTEEHMQRIGREEAASILPTEMSMMLPVGSPAFREVALMCEQEENAPLEVVWQSFAEKLIDLIWAPPAGIVPRLPGLSETDVRAKLHLFWRCAVALCVMPLSHIGMLSRRKASICPALATSLPEEGVPPPAERLAHVRLNLPVFSMIAEMPREEKPESPPVNSTETSIPAGRDDTGEDLAVASDADEEDKLVIEEIETESKSESNATRPTPAPSASTSTTVKENSAARHTYDLGYKKWENFDVDDALRDMDRPEPRQQKVDVAALRAKEARQQLDFDNPVEALNKVIEESKRREAPSPDASSSSSKGFKPGCRVSIQGVKAKPELNGFVGKLADFDAEKCRWQVQLPDGASKLFKEDNLEFAPEESLDAAAANLEGSEVAQLTHASEASEAPAADEGWVKVPVTEDVDDDEQDPVSGSPQRAAVESPSPAPAAPALLTPEKARSLQDQYKRWDKFDVDAALDAASDDERPAESAKLSQSSSSVSKTAAPVVKSSKAAEVVQQKATPQSKQLDQEERLPESTAEPTSVAQTETVAGESTAASLTSDYAKWETYDDCEDVDEIDEDDMDDGMDLDALTGPKEEVARIRSHWRREMAVTRRLARAEERKKAAEAAARRAELRAQESLAEGPARQRPCEYRPPSDPKAASAKAISREYNKWKNFDADKAILEIDNDGKTEEGDAMRCEARKGSAMISAEGYAKDREEYDLDQDIEKQMGGLKKVIAQRFKDASASKAEGNALLKARQPKEACKAYLHGLEMMDLCSHATVIMADSMADKNARLVQDLQRNLAAAQLEAGDFEGARASCDAILNPVGEGDKKEVVEDEKARYRRAVALLRLGRNQDAEHDIAALAAMRGEDDTVVLRLRNEAGVKRHV